MRRGDGAPKGAAPRTPGKESDTPEGTTPDPLTADAWGARCLVVARELAVVGARDDVIPEPPGIEDVS